MSERINLADPEFEPTDAQLIELSTRAFSGVRKEREEALADLRAKIAAARAEVLQSLDTGRAEATK